MIVLWREVSVKLDYTAWYYILIDMKNIYATFKDNQFQKRAKSQTFSSVRIIGRSDSYAFDCIILHCLEIEARMHNLMKIVARELAKIYI